MYKLSIITINYNNAQGLKKTMESVFCQTSMDFEYLVIDGGSIDESVNVIRQFDKTKIRKFIWISEPDKGIYNAMNKGIMLSQGEYVQFLNSGDELASSNVTSLMLLDMPDCSVLSGDMQLMSDNKYVKWKGPSTRKITFMTLYQGAINHSPSYIKRSLFYKYGFYDESLKIVSDWKFFLITIGLNNESIVLRHVIVTKFDLSGISSTNMELRKMERRMVLEELIPKVILTDFDDFALVYNKFKLLNKYKILSLIFDLIFKILNKFNVY